MNTRLHAQRDAERYQTHEERLAFLNGYKHGLAYFYGTDAPIHGQAKYPDAWQDGYDSAAYRDQQA